MDDDGERRRIEKLKGHKKLVGEEEARYQERGEVFGGEAEGVRKERNRKGKLWRAREKEERPSSKKGWCTD